MIEGPTHPAGVAERSMALYLYSYLNLFEYIGSGTPEDPGTDFGMSVWIEAPAEGTR